jgi:phage terminase large subunit
VTSLVIETAEVFEPLLYPSRYKGAKGGRGSGKSHFFGDLWLDENVRLQLDCVCLREILKSLEFSVKKLLEQKIESHNAGAYFEVQDKRILTKQGGTTIFQGMQNHTAESIKSLEGFDRAWFAEAQNASQFSLDILRLMIEINTLGTAVLLATHNYGLLKGRDDFRRLHLSAGRLVYDGPNGNFAPAAPSAEV